jgi:hypothetical protein
MRPAHLILLIKTKRRSIDLPMSAIAQGIGSVACQR